MKKIFPVIAILITLSLMGLIFFQYTWLKTAKKIKETQLKENIYLAISEAAERLVEENSNGIFNKKKDFVDESERVRLELFRPLISQRFSIDQIRSIIRQSMEQHHLQHTNFEFAVFQNNAENVLQSDQFRKCYNDSLNNTSFVIQLELPSGSFYENVAPDEYLMVFVPDQKSIVLREILWFIIGTTVFTLIIVTAFFITIRALIRQKKLSEIKSDFINNMTHEFKTPIATVSLAVDALKNEKVIQDPAKTSYFIGIIKEENKRMNRQVETILQAALLEKQELELRMIKASAHDLISRALNNIQLQVEEKNGKISIALNANNDLIMADEVHFTNLINNLLDNAVKYSKEAGPDIEISTSSNEKHILITVSDQGIGMTRETLSRIFEKFYRAHTGNLHNVKGFGLGLSYVKTMVDAHNGTIKADSSPGKGSTFIIRIPLA